MRPEKKEPYLLVETELVGNLQDLLSIRLVVLLEVVLEPRLHVHLGMLKLKNGNETTKELTLCKDRLSVNADKELPTTTVHLKRRVITDM